jgi:hypothetical protein
VKSSYAKNDKFIFVFEKICEGSVEELYNSSSPQVQYSRVDNDNGKHETGEMTIDDLIAIFTRWEQMMQYKDDN